MSAPERPGRRRPRVLRIYHSGVVSAWRQRDRELRALGLDVTLIAPMRWNEGGSDVSLSREGDEFVVPARTLGRHPYLFVYDPRPIIRALRTGEFDVLDVHEEPASLAALEVRLLAWLLQRRVPIVFYSAQNIERRYPPPFRWIERTSLRRAAGAHCCNHDAASILRRKGLDGIIRVIGLGVDVDRFGDTAVAEPHEPLVVGYVGRLEHRKGVGVLVDAVAGVEGVRLELWGDGPDRGAFVEQVARLGLQDRVRFRGYAAHDRLPQTYAAFDMLAVPSLRTPTWVEQFGRVAVESMAAGTPVIVSDDGALPEVVGDAGVLVAPGEVDAWRAAIDALSRDHERRRTLAARGRERARRYAWSAVARAQYDHYLEVMGRAGAERGDEATDRVDTAGWPR